MDPVLAIRTWWKTSLFIGGSLATVATAWLTVGLPMPAFSSDIMRLEKGQLGLAITVYDDKLTSLIIRRAEMQEAGIPASNPEFQRQNRLILQLENELQSARDRAIKLGQ